MLYQPTNLIPSAFAGEGNDVIDASQTNVFSALLTGSSSTIWAYQVKIMQNDTNSTLAYDTGVVQLSEAFYPMNYNGVQNRLEITIPSYNDDPNNLMRNEIEEGYKWTLSVWEQYSAGSPDDTKVTSVEQFFWTKVKSTIQIDPTTAPATITSRENLWKAIYTSTSSVQWFQWTLAEVVDGAYNTVYQTKRIYGSSQIWFEYSGLVSDRTYAVQVQVVNQYGQSVTSPWVQSAVSYDTVTVSGATNIQQTEEGVQSDWSGVQFIEGTALYKADDSPSNNYQILNNYPVEGQHTLDVEDDTYVRFESSPTFEMQMSDDGTVVWAGQPDRYDPNASTTLLEFTDTSSNQIRTLQHVGFRPGLEPGGNIDVEAGSADILTVNASTGASAKSLLVNIEPDQDLHGYANPWPAGGWANLLDPSKCSAGGGAYGINVTFDSATNVWTFSGTATTTSASAAFSFLVYSDYSLSNHSYAVQAFDISGTGTECFKSVYGFRTESEKVAAIVFNFSSVQTINITLKMSVAATSQSSWTPYSNICPITGHTSATVTRTGKNLLNNTDLFTWGNWSATVAPDGDMKSTDVNRIFTFPKLEAGKTYVISFGFVGSTFPTYLYFGYHKDGTATRLAYITTDSLSRTEFSFTAVDGYNYCLRMGSTNTQTGFNNQIAKWSNCQLELGSTASAYEPYTGTSYPVTWQTEAGTVYGGTVDVVSGVLTVDCLPFVFDNTAWTFSSTFFYLFLDDLKDVVVSGYYMTENGVKINLNGNNGQARIYLSQNPFIASDTDVGALLNGYKLIYELATPLTYQLTPTQVSMLLGTNNMWANTGSIESAVISTEIVPGQPLVPDDGAGGHYAYTVNGHTYTQDTLHAPYHWYVVEMPPDGIVVHEFDNPGGGA